MGERKVKERLASAMCRILCRLIGCYWITVRTYDVDYVCCARCGTRKEEDTVDKLGVDETGTVSQEELEKKAMAGCPKCGGRVERHGAILTCANCGTEPWEGEGAK